MNLALITAAGIGSRINSRTPKQFLSVFGRPVLTYTLSVFQNHPDIDAICVVVLDGWAERLKQYANEYGFTKLRHIVIGGQTGQDSIRIGLDELYRHYSDEDLVLIHDGVRPLVPRQMISDCIHATRKYGNAIAAINCQEAIMRREPGCNSATESIPRETLCRTQTPHGFVLGDIVRAHHDALGGGITNSVAGCTLMTALGRRVFFYPGTEKNIKITTPEDFHIFMALLKAAK